MLGDPGADSQHGTKILQAKSARVKVYKTSDKALWAFTLIGPVPEGRPFLPLIGQKNIFLANQTVLVLKSKIYACQAMFYSIQTIKYAYCVPVFPNAGPFPELREVL